MMLWHAGCLPALSGQLWLQGERMLFLFICLFSDNFLRHHIFLCEPSVGSWWCWQSPWNGRSSSPQRKAFMFQGLKFQNIFLLLCYSQFFYAALWWSPIYLLIRWIPLLSWESTLEKLFLLAFMKLTTAYFALHGS